MKLKVILCLAFSVVFNLYTLSYAQDSTSCGCSKSSKNTNNTKKESTCNVSPLEEINNAIKLTQSEQVLDFISHMPMRKYSNLEELCKEAKSKDPNKRLLIWTVKSHACDSKNQDNYGMCLASTYSISDPQNKHAAPGE